MLDYDATSSAPSASAFRRTSKFVQKSYYSYTPNGFSRPFLKSLGRIRICLLELDMPLHILTKALCYYPSPPPPTLLPVPRQLRAKHLQVLNHHRNNVTAWFFFSKDVHKVLTTDCSGTGAGSGTRYYTLGSIPDVELPPYAPPLPADAAREVVLSGATTSKSCPKNLLEEIAHESLLGFASLLALAIRFNGSEGGAADDHGFDHAGHG